ncbi:unnamed protein product [Peronospora belbahrii]|uniref:CNNM transmembrane domain-containing protein n=1 Tax=Peronospora belbahrii TaxID=622444 RepID=A0AAU9KVT9_9STRA|nr:unnamed protein product [Peronospora belbahrii]
MAGLTMGLLSLDMLNMRILEMEGSDDEKRHAKQVLPVLTQHHFLLVTLLIVNASANEALPIFLNKLVPEAVSIILSVTCVLLFGEIIPSAVFTVEYLIIGLEMIMIQHNINERKLKHWLHFSVKMMLLDPLLTPRSLYEDSAHGTRLHVDEVTIIHGALDLASKTVTEVMIPMDDVYMLELDVELSPDMLASVLASGHSRIPVYEKHKSNIVGLLLVKKLIVLDPDDRRPIRDLILRKPILVSPKESCYSILNEFQKGHSHIALVTPDVDIVLRCWRFEEEIPESVVFKGIVTIEDVIEELIQEEIEDESDIYVHDIVDYWQARYRKVIKGTGSTFVKKRLRLLADRARRRVKSRRSKQAAESATAKSIRATGLPQLDAPLSIKVVSEKTPLL